VTDLERLRLRIADKARVVVDETIGRGDGVLALFQTQFAPLVENHETVYLQTGARIVALARGVDYTCDAAHGLVQLAVAPEADARVRAVYYHTIFSEAELNDLLAQAGDVTRAAILALQILLADVERFIKYTLGQETVDRVGTRDALTALLAELKASVSGVPGVKLATSDAEVTLLSPFLGEWA